MLTAPTVTSMPSVHQPVEEGTGEQEQIRQDAENMSSMFGKDEESTDGKKGKQHQSSSGPKPTPALRILLIDHFKTPGPA